MKPNTLKALRKLGRRYQDRPVEAMPCIVMKDREEARHWIELRHTGENEGAGTMRWGSDESARFKARSTTPEIHSQALDFLQRRGDLTPEMRSKVPAASLKRLMETPQVRNKMGVELQSGMLTLLADEKRIAKALMHVVDDLVTKKIGTRDIYTKEQRRDYAKKLPSEAVVTPTIKSGQGTPLADIADDSTKNKKRAGQPSHRGQRRKLIQRECVLAIPPGRIKDIETELRKLDLEEHTNAISVLFRVFIELSVDEYLTDHPAAGITEDSALQKKMAAVGSDLVSKKKLTEKQRTPVSRACQKDSFLAPSINLMHNWVHNAHIFPAPGDLRAHWNSLQPFFTAIWSA